MGRQIVSFGERPLLYLRHFWNANKEDCNILPNGCRTDGSDFYFFVLEKNAQDILFGAFSDSTADLEIM